jgi:hypothetical protein
MQGMMGCHVPQVHSSRIQQAPTTKHPPSMAHGVPSRGRTFGQVEDSPGQASSYGCPIRIAVQKQIPSGYSH